MGRSRYGMSVQAMHNGSFIGGLTLIMDADARKAEDAVFNELAAEALRRLGVDAKYAWVVWFHRFAPEGSEMGENVKPLPVTAGVLALRLCDLVGEVAAFDYNPRSGALRFDGTIDLEALASWSNKRMGATEGSE